MCRRCGEEQLAEEGTRKKRHDLRDDEGDGSEDRDLREEHERLWWPGRKRFARIVPSCPYSPLMTSTPRIPIANRPMKTPMRLVLIGSNPCRFAGEVVNQCARVSEVANAVDADAEHDGDSERPHR